MVGMGTRLKWHQNMFPLHWVERSVTLSVKDGKNTDVCKHVVHLTMPTKLVANLSHTKIFPLGCSALSYGPGLNCQLRYTGTVATHTSWWPEWCRVGQVPL